jgi:lipopolysaccharide export system protein LptA
MRKALIVLAMAGAAIGLIFYGQEFAKIDPLLGMRQRNLAVKDQVGISLGDVHYVHFSGPRKSAEADMESVFIPSHRGEYRMETVKNGTYFTEDGKVHFSAPTAKWDAIARVLTADNGVRVSNKDFDIKANLIRIHERNQTLYVPGKFGGKFYRGAITSMNLLFDMKKDLVTVGPTHWNGNLALSLQDGAKPQLKRWEFDSAKGTIKIKGKNRIWEKGTATDGDIIVQADLIEHNETTDIVTATGNVRYFSPKANVACEKAVIYRKEKRAVLTGSVDMLVKPKNAQTKAEIVEIPPFRPAVPTEVAKNRPAAPPTQQQKLDEDVQSPKTLHDYPIAITSAKIEYWYGRGNRHAIITGDPQARQELPEGRWRHLWAYSAYYDGEKETLKMESRPGNADTRVMTSVGDDIVAEEVVVSTKEDDEDLEAKGAKGKIYGKPDEDDTRTPPPDPIKPGKAGGGGLRGDIRQPPKQNG